MPDTAGSQDVAQLFRGAFRQHPAGVAAITADPGDGPVALTVSSLVSVSAEPPTVAFSLSDGSSSAPAIRRARTMVIHLLRLQDRALAELCARPGADRFGPGVAWSRLPTGEPHFHDVGIWFHARILHRFPVSGATIVVAELLAGRAAEPGPEAREASMVYVDREWHGLRPAGGEVDAPLPGMAALAPLVGTWDRTVTPLDAGGRAGEAARATDSYAWAAGGRVLLHEVDARVGGERMRSLEVIAPDPAGGGFVLRSYDPDGTTSDFAARRDGRGWEIDGAAQRFRGAFGEDGRTLAGRWERRDGEGWAPLMDVRLVRRP